MSQPGGLEKTRGPVEFNHAISYVNKIKVSATSFRNDTSLTHRRTALLRSQISTSSSWRSYIHTSASRSQSKRCTVKSQRSSKLLPICWKTSSNSYPNQLRMRRLWHKAARSKLCCQTYAEMQGICSPCIHSRCTLPGQIKLACLRWVISHLPQILAATTNESAVIGRLLAKAHLPWACKEDWTLGTKMVAERMGRVVPLVR